MTTKCKMRSMPSANCHVEIERDSNSSRLVRISLVSYSSEVIRIYPDENDIWFADLVDCAVNYSPTTARHVNRFTTEFFGENLYHTFKKYDFEHPMPYVVEQYNNSIVTAVQWYENNGKKIY